MRQIFLFLVLSLATLAGFTQQQKNDVILKINGDELVGKVLKVNDNSVEFAYVGETLSYTIRNEDIMKITFASGRVQVFNKPPLPSDKTQPAVPLQKATASPEERRNKVAILPFTFVSDGQATDDAISDQVQDECYSFMSKHSGNYKIVDPGTTNTALVKAGITKENIKGYSMDDICSLLGVEYVVKGAVTMNKTTQTNYQSTSGSSTTKDNSKNNDKKKETSTSTYGTTTQNYQTNLSLSIYNDKGANLYNQNRTSFWNTQDAYKSTLEYLLKRSPLYSK
jgi:TolB-like protein